MYQKHHLDRQTIESALSSHPDLSIPSLASLLGTSPDQLRELLIHYGFREKQARQEFETTHIDKWDLVAHLRLNPQSSIEELSQTLHISESSLQRLFSEYGISLPKGPKIPYSPDEMENKVRHYCLSTRLSRKDIAIRLGVSPPTVSNYVKRLKEKGTIPQEFSFRRNK